MAILYFSTTLYTHKVCSVLSGCFVYPERLSLQYLIDAVMQLEEDQSFLKTKLGYELYGRYHYNLVTLGEKKNAYVWGKSKKFISKNLPFEKKKEV